MAAETGIPKIIQLLTDYGISLVIVGVFLYFIIRLLNIGIDCIARKVKETSHDEALNIRDQVGIEINDILSKLLEDCDSDRVQVIEFSNSVMSVAFLPFRYMTCTYEVYKFGKAGLGHRIDHISTSLFAKFFQSMEHSEVCAYSIDHKEPAMGGAMYDIMKEDGNHRALCCKLISDTGKFIGYLSMMKDDPFTSEESDAIQDVACKVSSLLGVLDK